jgi:hypothetical protein
VELPQNPSDYAIDQNPKSETFLESIIGTVNTPRATDLPVEDSTGHADVFGYSTDAHETLPKDLNNVKIKELTEDGSPNPLEFPEIPKLDENENDQEGLTPPMIQEERITPLPADIQTSGSLEMPDITAMTESEEYAKLTRYYSSSMDECSYMDSTMIDDTIKFAMYNKTSTIPTSYKEALTRDDADQWIKACNDEYKSLIEHNTWGELVPLPKGRSALGTRWVLTQKFGVNNELLRYKARSVIQGFRQKYGVDYYHTFAPVASHTTVRLLLTIAAHRNLELFQYDVKTAFLHGNIDIEDIYIKQPEGFQVKGKENYVFKLLKSQYGLKQASRIWYQVLDKVLLEAGLTRSKRDPCLYFKITITETTLIVIYVDDIIGTSTKKDYYKQMMEKSSIDLKEMDTVNHYLAMRITRYPKQRIIGIDQEIFINKILNKFNMTESNAAETPMNQEVLSKSQSPSTNEDINYMRTIPYREAVGSLMYLMVCTRPDIAMAVSEVSKFLANPGRAHWTAVKRILRYLKGTKSLKLILGGVDNLILTGYTDADYARDVDSSISRSGYVTYLGSSILSWKSKMQKTTATSTAESEYYALSSLTKELLYLLPLVQEFGIKQSLPIIIHEDNQGTIAMANKHINNSRSKHIRVKYHFVREHIENKMIQLQYCKSENNVADILTKPLERIKLSKFKEMLQLKNLDNIDEHFEELGNTNKICETRCTILSDENRTDEDLDMKSSGSIGNHKIT